MPLYWYMKDHAKTPKHDVVSNGCYPEYVKHLKQAIIDARVDYNYIDALAVELEHERTCDSFET